MQKDIYSSNGQEISLFGDGTFTATLSNGVSKSGTYTTSEIDDVILEVVFDADNEEFYCDIINNEMSLPEAWDNGSGNRLKKQG